MCLPNWVRWAAVLLGLCGSTTVAAGERLSVEQHPRFESPMPVWAEALCARRYRAVVALRDTAAGLQPVGETESLLAEHWLAHPDHAGWRERLDRALSARTVRPAGELTNRQRCSQDPGGPT